jgi:hypothetical protein
MSFAMRFLADVTYPDGQQVVAGTQIRKAWYVRNTGSRSWNGVTLRRVSGHHFHVISTDHRVVWNPTPPNATALADRGEIVAFAPETRAGDTVELTVTLDVGTEVGRKRADYRLYSSTPASSFGEMLWIDIVVIAEPEVAVGVRDQTPVRAIHQRQEQPPPLPEPARPVHAECEITVVEQQCQHREADDDTAQQLVALRGSM